MFESAVVPEAPEGRRSAALSLSTLLQVALITARGHNYHGPRLRAARTQTRAAPAPRVRL